LTIIPVRVGKVYQGFPAELQNIQEVPIAQVLQRLAGNVIEATAICFYPVSLEQLLIDLLEELCLRICRPWIWQEMVEKAYGHIEQFLSYVKLDPLVQEASPKHLRGKTCYSIPDFLLHLISMQLKRSGHE
jgi:hypothetical protein